MNAWRTLVEVNVPQPIARSIQPLLDALPLERAMQDLVVTGDAPVPQRDVVEHICATPEIAARPVLQAGLWLYVDDLDRSHTLSQGSEDATGSFWHGIMHRREGDFSNSHYWFNRVGQHPAMRDIPGYDPHAFIDAVSARHASCPNELVSLQRDEWVSLFTWCANR